MKQIRTVLPKDVKALQKICIKTFSDTFCSQNTPEDLKKYLEDSYSENLLLSEINDPNSVHLFVEVNGNVAGFLKLNYKDSQTEDIGKDYAEIQRIYIDSDYKRQGLGSLLMEEAIKNAKAKKCPAIWLGVWEKNFEAQRFYQKYGFERIGEHTFVLGKDPQTDWILLKKL